jgi:SAM-dependent methyltransferase
MSGYSYSLEAQRARNKELLFDEQLAGTIVTTFKPESLVDVGCGAGWYCAEAEKLGVKVVVGLDATPYLNRLGVWDVKQVDVTKSFEFSVKYDLALCLEVAHCLDEKDIPTLLDNLCGCSRRIVFSAAQPGQVGPGMITQWDWRIYAWLFHRKGYEFDEISTLRLRESAQRPWLKRNVAVYIKEIGNA